MKKIAVLLLNQYMFFSPSTIWTRYLPTLTPHRRTPMVFWDSWNENLAKLKWSKKKERWNIIKKYLVINYRAIWARVQFLALNRKSPMVLRMRKNEMIGAETFHQLQTIINVIFEILVYSGIFPFQPRNGFIQNYQFLFWNFGNNFRYILVKMRHNSIITIFSKVRFN